ncbi:hypothetical protein [Cerasicoccus fimbriatus]|uniref:hypothetical protein n=1 Tax=Cerasicoccus fimbriatus TaxID=3014554 RepID=UPI0022B5CB2C|nr:hypothetical protein [Cerasicoccus sp. TK19100]
MTRFPATSILGGLLALVFAATLSAKPAHQEFMATDAVQADLKGKVKRVKEVTHKADDNGIYQEEDSEIELYDIHGSLIEDKTYDSEGELVESTLNSFDDDGTWTRSEETDEDGKKTYKILLDQEGRRLASVEETTGETEVTTFTENGFEDNGFTKSARGKMLKRFSILRNPNNKERHLVFEEPAGVRSAVLDIQWNENGDESAMTINFFKDKRFTVQKTYKYTELDEQNNWLIREVVSSFLDADGKELFKSYERVVREITYHE